MTEKRFRNKHMHIPFLRRLPAYFLAALLSLAVLQHSAAAQESGPLMMKQELGYTLGGGVIGTGLGVLVWFMDPLNPSVTLRGNVRDGFVVGSTLGALFGFYLLQNAAIFPNQAAPTNIDQLLGREEDAVWPATEPRSPTAQGFQINVPVWQFRF